MENNEDVTTQIKTFLVKNPLSSLQKLLIYFKDTLSEKEILKHLSSIENVVLIHNNYHDVYAIAQCVKDNYNLLVRQIDIFGNQTVIADLYVLSDDSVYVRPHHKDTWLTLGSDSKMEGLFQSLPWYLTSMKPLGYLGRIWKSNFQRLSKESVSYDFSNKEIIEANAFYKLDVSGNLNLIQSNNRVCVEQFLDYENRLEIYEKLIEQLEAGSMVGSTMDGDQQKFAITLKLPNGKVLSVIVKSNFAERPDIMERQADLLIMEHCSNEVLRKHRYQVAKTQILKSDNFIYLESERFDRTPEGGSRGFVSLRSVCSATYFMGRQSEWIEALQHLHGKGLISNEDKAIGTDLTIVGRLIDNKDMHLGNLSLWLPQDGSKAFSLAPVYDMTSMQWTPSLKGYVPVLYVFDKVPEASFELTQIAKEIWGASANHPYISADWKVFAEKKVEKFEQKLRTMFQENKATKEPLTKINKNLMP